MECAEDAKARTGYGTRTLTISSARTISHVDNHIIESLENSCTTVGDPLRNAFQAHVHRGDGNTPITHDSENIASCDSTLTLLPRTLKSHNSWDSYNSYEAQDPFAYLPENIKQRIRDRGIANLYDWQKEVLTLEATRLEKNLVYSLPTSGGKTLVSEILILRRLLRPRHSEIAKSHTQELYNECASQKMNTSVAEVNSLAMYVLPYVSLVEERVESFRSLVDNEKGVNSDPLLTKEAIVANGTSISVEAYAGAAGRYPPPTAPSVFVCTIEKASGMLNTLYELDRIDELGIVVIDELHMVSECNGRGAVLESFVARLLAGAPHVQIVGMSATVPNLEHLSSWISAHKYKNLFRPVKLMSYTVSGGIVKNAGYCRADIQMQKQESLGSEEKMFEDTNETKSLEDTTFQNNDALPVRTLTLSNALTEREQVLALVEELFLESAIIVFCATKLSCESMATFLAKKLWNRRKKEASNIYEELDLSLPQESKENYSAFADKLVRLLPFRVGYHHGGLTADERTFIESAFRSKRIYVLCATSTLAAGVNLPVRRVVFHSPYIGKNFLRKSQYLQMCGRAGRAGLDPYGESYLVHSAKDAHRVHSLVAEISEPVTSAIRSCPGISSCSDTGKLQNTLCQWDAVHENYDIQLEYVLSRYLLEIVGCGIAKSSHGMLESVKQLLCWKEDELLISRKTLEALRLLEENKLFHKVAIGGRTTTEYASTLSHKYSTERGAPGTPDYFTKRSECRNSIYCKSAEFYELSPLGLSVFRSNLPIPDALLIHSEIVDVQRKGLIMEDDLHIVYMLTPIRDMLEPHWSTYQRRLSHLSALQMNIAESIGVSEHFIQLRASGICLNVVEDNSLQNPTEGNRKSPHTSRRAHFATRRFWSALILFDLLREVPVDTVAERYNILPGQIQNLMKSASFFSTCMTAFAQAMGWYALESVLSGYVKRLGYGVRPDVLPLMAIKGVQATRARLLWQAGYRTIKQLAQSDPEKLLQRLKETSANLFKGKDGSANAVKYLTKRSALKLIHSAHACLKETTSSKYNEIRELNC